MARISLTPQKREFFDLFSAGVRERGRDRAAARPSCSNASPSDGEALIAHIQELEHEGDRLTHEVVDLLNRTFVTPFDRDDMYRLAGALDDICDHVDEAADNIDSTASSACPAKAREQAEVIHRAATRLHEAVARLEGFKDSSASSIELRELEDEGDRSRARRSPSSSRSTDDAMTFIRWKDIHEQLEEAVDACENAADVLEAILVKNR